MAKAVVAVRAKRRVARNRMIIVRDCRTRAESSNLSLRRSGYIVGI